MRDEQDSLLALRVPLDDHVRHRHLLAAERIVRQEPLKRHLAAQLLEMLL